MPVVGAFSGRGQMIGGPVWSPAAVGPAEVEGLVRLVGEDGTAIAVVEVELECRPWS